MRVVRASALVDGATFGRVVVMCPSCGGVELERGYEMPGMRVYCRCQKCGWVERSAA